MALACITEFLIVPSVHSLLESNASAVDNKQLSSYLRAPRKQCTPGPKLSKWQSTPLRLPFVPFVTLTEAHSGSTWFRTMLNSHPCVRSHGETLRKRTDLKDLWETLSRPTKTDDPRAVRVPLYAAGLKGFFTPTGGSGTNKRGDAADKSRHDFNPTNKEVFNPVANFLKESQVCLGVPLSFSLSLPFALLFIPVSKTCTIPKILRWPTRSVCSNHHCM